MNEALDSKYRPRIFGDVLGQEGTVKVLGKTLADVGARVGPSIFFGPFGSGKTTLARIYGRSILCTDRKGNGDPCNECSSCQMFFSDTHPGYIEIDGAKITKKDDFQKILESTDYQQPGSQYRVFLIDECHMMSKASQNLFLKPLEEGIENVFWLFCTTEFHKIIETIRSRCLDYAIRPISYESITERMANICEQEGIPYEQEAIAAVVSAKRGHIRDVLKFASQVRSIGGVTGEVVYDYLDIGVNDSYFEILGYIKDAPSDAMALLDTVLTKVSAMDAYNGLAEAAMDAFKSAKGIRCSMVVRDKEIRQKPLDAYGEDITRAARFLIQNGSRRIDTSYLTSTLLLMRDHMMGTGNGTSEKVVVREVVREVPATAAPKSSPELTPQPKENVPEATSPVAMGTRRDIQTELERRAQRQNPIKEIKVEVKAPKTEEGVLSEKEFGLRLQRGWGNGR